jgi:SIR2-like protein
MPEPPYGVIWNRLLAGKVVPFLGAGASMFARQPGSKWDGRTPAFLPSGAELAGFLADETSFPSTDERDIDDLAKVCSYYVDVSSRPVLRERLRYVFNRSYECGILHSFLAQIPTHLLIVSTNYDTLLEQAFRKAGKPYDLVIYPADVKEAANAVLWWPHGASSPEIYEPNQLDVDLQSTSVIYKMHGTVAPADRWDSFVISEEDYIDFLSRLTTRTAVPAAFFSHCRERSFLFLGYGLRDWNLRVVLRNLSRYVSPQSADDSDAEETPRYWAIQKGPSELEMELWERRNVKIYDMDLEEFVRRMQQRREA